MHVNKESGENPERARRREPIVKGNCRSHRRSGRDKPLAQAEKVFPKPMPIGKSEDLPRIRTECRECRRRQGRIRNVEATKKIRELPARKE